MTAPLPSVRRGGRWPLAVAAAVGVHLLILTAFVLGLRIAAAPAELPAIDVELTPPWTPARRPPPTPMKSPSPATTAVARPPVAAPALPDQPTVIAAAPTAPTAATPSALSGALKGALGCGHTAFLHLTADEQRACLGRLAGTPGGAARGFGVDPAKRMAFDAAGGPLHGEWMSTMPIKGCRPRSTLTTIGDPAHAQHDLSVGITCVIRF